MFSNEKRGLFSSIKCHKYVSSMPHHTISPRLSVMYNITQPVFSGILLLFVNTLRPRQNGRHFADDTFKRIFLNGNVRISIKISLNFVPKWPIINIPALVQIMAWRRPGDKSLSEAMVVSLLTHICVTRPQWVNVIDSLSSWYTWTIFHSVGHTFF